MTPSPSLVTRSLSRLLPDWLQTMGGSQRKGALRHFGDITLLCTPNSAIIDSWYAPLKYAKDANPHWTVRVIFPSFYQIKKLDLADSVIIGIQGISSCFLFRGLDHRLYAFRTLPEAKAAGAASLKLASVFAPKKRRASMSLVEWMEVERVARSRRWKLFSSCLCLLPRHGWLTNRPTRKLLNALRSSTVAYDTFSQGKRNAFDILEEVLPGPRLSINHGLGLREPMEPDVAEEFQRERERSQAYKKDYRIYVYNELEKRTLINQLAVKQDRVIITGIPRLDPRAREIIAALRNPDDVTPWKKHILFISRSLENRYSNFKKDCLRSVHDFARENGLGLVIRSHPSESDARILEALPPEGDGHTWALSKAHPQELAKSALFAVCFDSALPVELLAYGVPTIAFGSIPGGLADTQERRLGLVLPADSVGEFREIAQALLIGSDTHVSSLTTATDAHYSNPRGALITILRDLETLAAGHTPVETATRDSQA